MSRPGLFSTLFPWRVHPTFTVLTVATGQFSDFFLFGMRVPLLPHLIRTHLHVSEAQVQSRVAILLAAFSLATLVTAIPAGWLADFGWLRGRLYLAGLGALLWSTIVFYTARTWETILLSRVLNGISAAVLYAAGFAMVVDVVPPGDLGKALGTIRSIAAVGELTGPPAGGLIYTHWGFGGILNVSLAALAVDLVMRALMVDRPREPVSRTRREKDKPVAMLPILSCLDDSQLVVPLILSFIQYIILGTFDSTLALEASNQFGIHPGRVGAIFLALAIPVLALAPLAGWAVDRLGPRVVAVVGFGCFAPTLAGMFFSRFIQDLSVRFGVFLCLLVLQGVCLAIVSTPSMIKAKQAVEKTVRDDPARFGSRGAMGQMFGLTTLVSSSGLLVGDYVCAAVRDAIGYGFMNLILSGLCILAAVLAWVFFREEVDEVGSPDDAECLEFE
ncbi:major facilitator superfamily domain-containing protein [Schizothecium vesticola]|uniref:Major facilitator superfamily domain-containing protein n=1 Tax=Schizothecium vesticola TaxID=314040 RepID=A0AA40F5N8_9PEZI|nr:major facilitator superfamily domain-containing protein [Schizothecium vesticola]